MKKGWYSVSGDRQLLVNLEVTVPRLVLPIPSPDVDEASDKMEQVRLSTIDAPDISPIARSSLQRISVGEAAAPAAYATQQEPFRLFSIKRVQAHGQVLLLQVLRHWKRDDEEQHRTVGRRQPFRTSEELAFTVEVRHRNAPSETTRETLLPGLNLVVISLDEEGIPNSYTIDGAER